MSLSSMQNENLLCDISGRKFEQPLKGDDLVSSSDVREIYEGLTSLRKQRTVLNAAIDYLSVPVDKQ